MLNKKLKTYLTLSLFALSGIAATEPLQATNDTDRLHRDVSVYSIWFYSGQNSMDPPFIVIGYCATESDLPVDIRVSVNKETQLIRFFSYAHGCTSTQVPVDQFRSIHRPGLYSFTAIVDAKDMVPESNEDNNEITESVTVSELE